MLQAITITLLLIVAALVLLKDKWHKEQIEHYTDYINELEKSTERLIKMNDEKLCIIDNQMEIIKEQQYSIVQLGRMIDLIKATKQEE